MKLRQDVRAAVEHYLGDLVLHYDVEAIVQDMLAAYGLREDYPIVGVASIISSHRVDTSS